MTKEKLFLQTEDFGFAKSSLMLLNSKENLLTIKVKKHGSFPKYLRFLINRYAINLKNDFLFEFRNTKNYQTRGLVYLRIKFKVDGKTWMSYQLLALYFRVSISNLFAILLRMDVENCEDFDEKKIVTVNFKQILLNFRLYMTQIPRYDYECLLKLKI